LAAFAEGKRHRGRPYASFEAFLSRVGDNAEAELHDVRASNWLSAIPG
jgi:hypothetical protein